MPDVLPGEKLTYVSASEQEGGIKYEIRSDAVELDPRYDEIFDSIDDEVARALRFHPMRGEFGFSRIFSAKKREILWKKYGIDWHSVQALTPELRVD